MEIISQKRKQNRKIKIRALSEDQNSVTPCLGRLWGNGVPLAWICCLLPSLGAQIPAQNLLRRRVGFSTQSGKVFIDTRGCKLNLDSICLEIKYISSLVEIIVQGKIDQESGQISVYEILEVKNRKEEEEAPIKKMLFKHFRKGLLTLLCSTSE